MWQYNHSNPYYSDELYHHGIKGQKWGVRRFQKKGGGLTSAGKKRYRAVKQKVSKANSNRLNNISSDYMAKGYSEAEARARAKRRIRIENAILATAAVSAAAAGVYVARKGYLREHTDQIIKADTTFQRWATMKDEPLDRPFFASYKKSDKNYYNHQFSKHAAAIAKGASTTPHRSIITAQKDLKAPSAKKATETFAKLYREDADFKRAVDSIQNNPKDKLFYLKGANVSKLMSKGKYSADRKAYDAFNLSLVKHDNKSYQKNAIDKFYGELKKQGYSAVQDMNDTKHLKGARLSDVMYNMAAGRGPGANHGYNRASPMIIFDTDAVQRTAQQSMKSKQVQDIIKKSNKIESAKKYGKYTAAGTTYIAASSVYGASKNKKEYKKYKERQKEKRDMAIEKGASIAVGAGLLALNAKL